MSILSSIISMKRRLCLNPAIKLTGVTLIVRHRRKFLIINAILDTAALNHRQIYPPPSSLVPSTVIWSQFVIKENSRESSASACDRLLFCVLHFFTFSPVAVADF